MRRDTKRGRTNNKTPVGVFSLQGKDWQDFDEDVRPALVRAEEARLAEIGMSPLATDYFFQDAQLLREICLAMKEPKKSSLRYAQQRATWYQQFLAQRLPVAKPKQAEEFLGVLSLHLGMIRGQVEKFGSVFNPDEMFKVELWCRDVDERALFQVGSSEFAPHDPRRARRFPLTTRTQATAAVASFTRSAPETMSAPIAQEHGRWRSFYAAPISLPEWYDLPVGALVIASTATIDPPASSLLASQDAIRRQLAEWLNPLQKALDPRQTFVPPGGPPKRGIREQLESKIGIRKR